MRNLLLGVSIGSLAAAPAVAAAPRERITLGREQDRPPERIDLTAKDVSGQAMAGASISADPDAPPRSRASYLRSVAMLIVPAALARVASPLTRRTDAEIRKGEKSGQLSKQEARRLRQANDAAAYAAWHGRMTGVETDAERHAIQGQAEAISSYVFERRSAAKVPATVGRPSR